MKKIMEIIRRIIRVPFVITFYVICGVFALNYFILFALITKERASIKLGKENVDKIHTKIDEIVVLLKKLKGI